MLLLNSTARALARSAMSSTYGSIIDAPESVHSLSTQLDRVFCDGAVYDGSSLNSAHVGSLLVQPRAGFVRRSVSIASALAA